MENKKYALWYVSGSMVLLFIDYIGTYEECLSLMDAREQCSWAIMPCRE